MKPGEAGINLFHKGLDPVKEHIRPPPMDKWYEGN